MTLKRFIHDAYTTQFEATILDVLETNGRVAVLLDQTWFYPEGGGQPADTGMIGDSAVLDVQYAGGAIHHFTDSKPEIGARLACRVDWPRRFDLMQQHSGQHLLSATFKNLYDANTVGFHLSDTYATIDLDQRLDAGQIAVAETAANEAITRNVPVSVHFPDDATLASMPLRKIPKVKTDIRVIEIQGVDHTPCGGTHVARTGEIGLVKIRKADNHKAGVRLTFLCGKRAFQEFQFRNDLVNRLSAELSAKPEELPQALDKVKADMDALRQTHRRLSEQLVGLLEDRLSRDALRIGPLRVIRAALPDLDMRALRQLSSSLTMQPGTIALLAAVNEDVKLLFARSADIPHAMDALIRPALTLIDGKGGGSPAAAQGGGALPDKAGQALDLAVTNLKDLLD